MTFGSRLKALRKEQRMLQKDLAILLDLSSDTIAKYERNQRTPNPDTLQKISSIFNTSVDYLLCNTDIQTSPEEQFLLDDVSDDLDEMDKKIDEFAEKHGILLFSDGDGKRYSKEELQTIIKNYLRMINTFKDIT
jgi:transcriptional regulator with XRE-family HTH domain